MIQGSNTVAGLKCLVLGAGGFLGTALSNALCEAGASVQGYGRAARAESDLDPRVVCTVGEFSDASKLAVAVQGQDVVFHLLGSSNPESSNRSPAEDVLASVVPTIRLIELCREAGVRKIIFASSGGTIYGVPESVPTPEYAATNPICAYGINKLAIEKYLSLYHRVHGVDYHVLRISNPYGPGQSPFKKQGVVAAIAYRILSEEPVEIWGSGNVVRDFIYVDDVVRAFVQAVGYSGRHKVMNLGSGYGRSVNDIVNDLQCIPGIPRATVRRTPDRPVDVPVSTLDTALIREQMRWEPRVPWTLGLQNTIKWLADTYGVTTRNKLGSGGNL